MPDEMIKRLSLAKALVQKDVVGYEELCSIGYDGVLYGLTAEQVEELYAKLFDKSSAKLSSAEYLEAAKKVMSEAEECLEKFKSITYERERPLGTCNCLGIEGIFEIGLELSWHGLRHISMGQGKIEEDLNDIILEMSDKMLGLVGSGLNTEFTFDDAVYYSLLELLQRDSIMNGHYMYYNFEFGEVPDYAGCGVLQYAGGKLKRCPILVEHALMRIVPTTMLETCEPRINKSFRTPMLYSNMLYSKGDDFYGIYLVFTVSDGGYDVEGLMDMEVTAMSGVYATEARTANKQLRSMEKHVKEGMPVTEYVVFLPLTLDEALSFCEVFGSEIGECRVGKFQTYKELHDALALVKEHKESFLEALDCLVGAKGILL